MSHSPIKDFNPQILAKYKNRWTALSRLLNADHSFSGRERHSAFLNLNGEKFADISAVSGFNFPEDGRALVLDDWDFDGDLDVILSARTAPRLRLLENNSTSAGDYLFIRLQGNGTTTNRDAIGSRCEVWLKGDNRPITRSLRAGDSFLSQSSSWLHFGLGHDAQIERMIVHWPAGKTEEFTGLENGKHYEIKQGEGKATSWQTPVESGVATSKPLDIPSESDQARIILPTPLLIPQLQTHDNTIINLSDSNDVGKGAVLVNFWSQTCPSCINELKEWTTHSDQFKAKNLQVLALNVDSISNPKAAMKVHQFLKVINFPHTSLTANEETLQRMDLFQRSILDRWQPIPVPCSFLLNSRGKVAIIYKGQVSAETLISDMALLDATPEKLREAATPFSGKWAEPAPFLGPQKYIAQLLDYKKIAACEQYYKRYLEVEYQSEKPPTGPMVQALKMLSNIASERKNLVSAVTHLKQAVTLVPHAPDLKNLLEQAEQKLYQSHPMLRTLVARVKAEPKNAKAHLSLADYYRKLGNLYEAADSYKSALAHDPELYLATGRLSWILATHPNPKIRDPKQALRLATKLMSLNEAKDPSFLDLQGIAFAANSNFPDAIKNARAALNLIEGESPYKKAIRMRLNLYLEEKAYYEGSINK